MTVNDQDFENQPGLGFDQPPAEPSRMTTGRKSSVAFSSPVVLYNKTMQNVCYVSLLLGSSLTFNLLRLSDNRTEGFWIPIHVYFISISLFHLLEFIVTATYNPHRVTVDSFLLNNGLSYYLAQVCSIVEYVLARKLESYPLYEHRILSVIGLALLIFGQLVRSLAMMTAARSFNHTVATSAQKQADHELVTCGIYRISRHPSYLGFFWWSLGIQIYLSNWFSLTLFTIVLWRFFNDRIQSEEKHLIKYFGKAYLDYRANTPTRIPFVP